MKTTANIPPDIAGEYAKAPRASAVAQATGDGYTAPKTPLNSGKGGGGQFGLPKSPGKKPPIKMGVGAIIDTDNDEPKLKAGKFRDFDKDKK
jgi:hypothetical protein